VVVDALLAKHNIGTHRGLAELTIGLGPGFKAPEDVHLALETMRGHNLGRLIYQGSTQPNTGIPGEMAGYTYQRVLRAPAKGIFRTDHHLGQAVREGEVVAMVDQSPVIAGVGGIIRGLLRTETPVETADKVGDVDPRGKLEYLNTISEKARAIGGSVLEGIMAQFNRP
jgi:xanthine dehydrogenase accessory factor